MVDTPTWHLPFPTLADPPNGPAAFELLAEATDAALTTVRKFPSGLASAIPAQQEGLPFWETDTDTFKIGDGAAWDTVWTRRQPFTVRNNIGGQNIQNSTETPWKGWTTLVHDNGGIAYNNSSGIFTIPAWGTGLYLIQVGVIFFNATGGMITLGAKVNGVRVASNDQTGAPQFTSPSVTAGYWLNAADEVSFSLIQNTGSVQKVEPDSDSRQTSHTRNRLCLARLWP